jgi:hypothetical protein
MARKRNPVRPSDPMEIALRRAAERARERDPGQWGADRDALSLPANAQVRLATDSRGRVSRAFRQDVFETFRARGALSQAGYDAVRRLQDDIATLHRTQTSRADYTPKVDTSRVADTFADHRARAGERIDAALTLSGVASARLLTALCEADVVLGRSADWRAVVESAAGERLPDAQGALVRAACENLAGAYAALDRGRRRTG